MILCLLKIVVENISLSLYFMHTVSFLSISAKCYFYSAISFYCSATTFYTYLFMFGCTRVYVCVCVCVIYDNDFRVVAAGFRDS